MENSNILTAKEWLKTVTLTKGCADPDTMERYASYKTKVSEDRILEFRKNLFSIYLQDSDIENIQKEFDKHFNITTEKINNMDKKLNGFNNGRDSSDGVGGIDMKLFEPPIGGSYRQYVIGIDPYSDDIPNSINTSGNAEITKREDKTLETKVFEALGEVSTCWIPNTGNAVFDSTKATEVGNRLMKEIKEKYEQPYLIDVNLIPKDFDINKFKELMRNMPLQVVQSKPSLEEAAEVLCNALREDKNKELFYKCFDEEYKLQFNSKPIIHSKEIALEAAKNFLNLLIKQ